MPGKGCGKGGHKKHTPIVSEKQRRFFGAEYGRAKRGEARKTEMPKKELRSHLKEAAGKDLPERRRKRKHSRESKGWEDLV